MTTAAKNVTLQLDTICTYFDICLQAARDDNFVVVNDMLPPITETKKRLKRNVHNLTNNEIFYDLKRGRPPKWHQLTELLFDTIVVLEFQIESLDREYRDANHYGIITILSDGLENHKAMLEMINKIPFAPSQNGASVAVTHSGFVEVERRASN